LSVELNEDKENRNKIKIMNKENLNEIREKKRNKVYE
jgi:hypothetical protein